MRYIGGKTQMLEHIIEIIKLKASDTKIVADLFSGSGIVAKELKKCGYKVITNDFLYFSYVLNRGELCLNNYPEFKSLKSQGIDNPINYLNELTINQSLHSESEFFIYNNYSPVGDCKRMYFQPFNAIKIDLIRLQIEDWKNQSLINDDEYFYLLASLINAVPFVSNITGVYGAYLKKWDPRTYKELKLLDGDIIPSSQKCEAYNEDINTLAERIEADLIYLDPPYNSRQYLPNYHILETIAKYDYPTIKGVTGLRDYSNQKSVFCQKAKAENAFYELFHKLKFKHLLVSYNNEGLISTEKLSKLVKNCGNSSSFELYEYDYRRYKSGHGGGNGLKEQIYYVNNVQKTQEKSKKEKKSKNVYNKSPMNYIGGKYKLLPQIISLFPTDINNFVDLFCGGLDVSTNINARNKYANDINNFVIEIFEEFQQITIEELLQYIDDTIKSWNLTKTNKEAYLAFRNHYNKTKNPLDLYILVCYSFNYQFRFNSKHEFNNPFGMERSCFSTTMRENLIKFHDNIKNIKFSCDDFRLFDISSFGKGDFIYADPPYTIACGSYNDGKRGFKGWSSEDDLALFAKLDQADKQGVKFAMSNVLEHKGVLNDELLKWADKYYVYYLDKNYNNASYQRKNKNKKTSEVVITNYEVER